MQNSRRLGENIQKGLGLVKSASIFLIQEDRSPSTALPILLMFLDFLFSWLERFVRATPARLFDRAPRCEAYGLHRHAKFNLLK